MNHTTTTDPSAPTNNDTRLEAALIALGEIYGTRTVAIAATKLSHPATTAPKRAS